MNYYMITFLLITLPFALFSIVSDLKTRKISNKITFSYIYISFLIFIFFLRMYDYLFYLCLIFSIIINFWLYYKKIWGGADAKIFLALTFLILALGNYIIFLDFILNLTIIYIISIFILIIFKTEFKDKIKVLKKIDYNIFIFQLLIIFLILKNIINNFIFKDSLYIIIFTLLIIMIFILLTPIFKKYFNKLNFRQKNLLNIFLFLLFLLINISHTKILLYFFIILIIKLLIDYLSNMTSYIRDGNNEQYYSPFSIYLFLSAIITIILQKNIIDIILFFIV